MEMLTTTSTQMNAMILVTIFYLLVNLLRKKRFIIGWNLVDIISSTMNIITLMVCTSLIIKINAGSVYQDCMEYPSWFLPWWICSVSSFMLSSMLFLLVLYPVFISSYDVADYPRNNLSEETMMVEYANPRYKNYLQKFSIVSIIILVIVFLIVSFSTILLCDPGQC